MSSIYMFVKLKFKNYVFCWPCFHCFLAIKGFSMRFLFLNLSFVFFLYMNPALAMSQTQEFDRIGAAASCSAEVGFMFSAVFLNAHKAFNYCMDRKMREWRTAHS